MCNIFNLQFHGTDFAGLCHLSKRIFQHLEYFRKREQTDQHRHYRETSSQLRKTICKSRESFYRILSEGCKQKTDNCYHQPFEQIVLRQHNNYGKTENCYEHLLRLPYHLCNLCKKRRTYQKSDGTYKTTKAGGQSYQVERTSCLTFSDKCFTFQRGRCGCRCSRNTYQNGRNRTTKYTTAVQST